MNSRFARITACASAAALAFGAGAGSALAAVTPPSQWPIVPLAEVLKANQAICDAHIGDPDSQIRVATASPHNFVEVGEEEDGTVQFWNGKLLLRVLDTKSDSGCLLRGRVTSEIGLKDGRQLGTPLYGSDPVTGDSYVLWRGRAANHFMTLAIEDDANLAGFGLFAKRKEIK